MRLLLALLLSAPLPACASGRNARVSVRAGGLGGTGVVAPVTLQVTPASLLGAPGLALNAPALGAAAAPLLAPALAPALAASPVFHAALAAAPSVPAPASPRDGPQRLIDALAAPFAEPRPEAGAAESAASSEKDFMTRAQLGGASGSPAAALAAPSAQPVPSGLQPAALQPRAVPSSAKGATTALAVSLLSTPRLRAGLQEATASLAAPPPSEGALLALLTRALQPSLRARARELGYASADEYAAWASSADGAAERERLLRGLSLLPEHSGEMFSGFFRGRHAWAQATQEHLDRAVASAAASGKRELRFKSLGVGSGQEPYSLALLLASSLRRAGEDPSRWSVAIESYDINARSLWSVTQGVFKHDEIFGAEGAFGGGLPQGYEALASELFPRRGSGAERQAVPLLRSWMEPVFLDLNDRAQQGALEELPGDVAFANNTMIHMRHGPSATLADRLLQGGWARPDRPALLNFNGMMVTEILPAGERSAPARLDSSDPLQVLVGASGGGLSHKSVLDLGEKMLTGLGHRPHWVVRGAQAALRALGWLKGGLALAPSIIPAALAHERALANQPSLERALSPELLAQAEDAAAARGLTLRLHFDPAPLRVDARRGFVSLNAALLFADGPPVQRRRRYLARALAGLPPSGAPLPARERFFDPSRGEGVVAAKGELGFGGVARAVRFFDGPRLLWLSGARYRPTFGLKRSDVP